MRLKIFIIFQMLVAPLFSVFAQENNLEFLKGQLKEIQALEAKVKQNILQEQQSKNITIRTLNFSLNPFFFRTLDKELSFTPSLSYEQKNNDYLFLTSFTYSYFDSQSFTTNIKSKSRSYNAQSELEVLNVVKQFSSISQFNYFREKEDEIYLTYYDLEIGPLGLGTSLVKKNELKLNFIFIPLYEQVSQSAVQTNQYQSNGSNIYVRKYARGIRASFQLSLMLSSKDKQFNWSLRSYFQPVYSQDRKEFVFRDNKFKIKSILKTKMNDFLYLSLDTTMEHNRQRKELQNLPSTDLKNELRLIAEGVF